MAIALITGATSGIGHAFAVELASQGFDLILVARDAKRLTDVSVELAKRYGINTEPLVADLGDRHQLGLVETKIAQTEISMLVNNAGFGLNEPLLGDTAIQENAMAVMATAVLVLSAAAGRVMAAQGHGTIINLGSISAWIIKGNYSAIKNWVVTYTKALADELDGTGVQATVVCPGWVKTELHERAGVSRPNLPSWLWLTPEDVVQAALKDAAHAKTISVPKPVWKIIFWVLQHSPQALPRYISKKIRKSRGGK